MLRGKVEKMFSVRQREWPAVGGMYLRVQRRYGSRLSSGSVDLHDGPAEIWREQDDVIFIPGSTARIRSVTEFDRGATISGDALQLSEREEPDRLSIG